MDIIFQMDTNEGIQNLQHTCRFCLTENENNLCIFTIENNIKDNLLEYKKIFEIHSGLELCQDDGLPKGVCLNCLTKFNEANKLWKQCQQSDEKLKTIYSNKYTKCLSPEPQQFKIVKIVSLQNDELFKNNQLSENRQLLENGELLDTEQFIEVEEPIENGESSFVDKQLQIEKLSSNENEKLSSDENENENEKVSLNENEKLLSNERSSIKDINMIKEKFASNDGRKTFSCKICGKVYFTQKFLINHEKTHEVILPSTTEEENNLIIEYLDLDLECEEEEVESNNNDELKTTITEEQLINDTDNDKKIDKNYLCHYCSKAFRHNSSLTVHLRTHTGDKPFPCQYCNRPFRLKAHCIHHERTHTGDKPYVCHYCGARFAKAFAFKMHLTIHTGEANYHCTICNKSFKRLSYLKEHNYTHTGERPYKCKDCGVAYSHSGSLFVHEKRCKEKKKY